MQTSDEMMNRPEFVEPFPMKSETSPTFLQENSEPFPASPKAKAAPSQSAIETEPFPTDQSGPMTPTKSRSQSPACPGAPRRHKAWRDLDDVPIPPPILIPSVDDHKECGILPEYFIKPEPGLPLWEKRQAILSELWEWFCSETFHQHVKDVLLLKEADQLQEEYVNWPAWEAAEYIGLYGDVANTCLIFYDDCVKYLEGKGDVPFAKNLLTKCTLRSGSTIAELWESSDLDDLREAESLSCAEEDEDEDEDEEEEEVVKEEKSLLELDIRIQLTPKEILLLLTITTVWLMINTYLLCRKYEC